MTAAMPARDEQQSRRVLRVGLAIVLIVLVRTAWVSDDSYITFRTADNLVHGYGPVWNVDERVQAYTHPLWLAVFTIPYLLTREPYFTSIALGMALTLGTIMLLGRRLAAGPWALAVCLIALLSSKAFVDYSTSGLENPLTHALLAAFIWRWWDAPEGASRLRQLTAIASLCLLTRLDLVVLLAPPLAVEMWRLGPRAAVRPVLDGALPILGWEIFSAFYYGSLVPNTFYAKAATGLPRGVLIASGHSYFLRTFWTDPSTLPTISLALVATLASRRRDWPLAVGILLNLSYVLWVGGDFMAGRFFTAPLLWSVCLLSRSPWTSRPAIGGLCAAALLVLGLSAPWEPAILSGYGYVPVDNLLHRIPGPEPRDKGRYVYVSGIADERRWYYESSGLLKTHRGQQRPDNPMVYDGLDLRQMGRQVVVRDGIGFTGYFAGPAVHIVDMFALADPLLARLPAKRDSRTGHFLRDIPKGYLETLETGSNRLADPDVAAFYDRLRLVISGPLWDRDRLVAAAELMLGRFNHLLAREWER